MPLIATRGTSLIDLYNTDAIEPNTPNRENDRRGSKSASPSGLAAVAVWTGAALFAGSLAGFLYAYLVRFGSAAGNPFLPAAAIDAGLFSLFALHHSAFARTPLKSRVAHALSPAAERSLYTWVASLLFILVWACWERIAGTAWAMPHAVRWIGYAAQLAGLWLTARGSARLDVLDLAGVRALLNARAGAEPRHVPLETTGVFGLVRHPLYFGWALFVFGAPEMTMTRLVFAVVSTAYLAIGIVFEERSLVATFGNDYREYRKRVRWRMIPGLY
jgi:protein-S-isoprenylcysteine O-methyltransferase Ste14